MTDKPGVDISSEADRGYHYESGKVFRITAPKTLHVLTDEHGVSHRVIASDGRTYRPERGWIGISWLPKPGAPAFVA
jgi:hypothetical protein